MAALKQAAEEGKGADAGAGGGEEVEALKKAVEEEKGKAVKLEEEVAALKKAAEEGKGTGEGQDAAAKKRAEEGPRQYDQSVVNVRPRHRQAPTNAVNK